jgi:divalent metal cation (Fe/Co/Zn/Cd) transporter
LYWLVSVIAIAVAFIIFKAGYDMTRKSLGELMDAAMTEEDQQVIVAIMQGHPMVKGFTNLRTRRSGSMSLVDVHLILDKDFPLNQNHHICD